MGQIFAVAKNSRSDRERQGEKLYPKSPDTMTYKWKHDDVMIYMLKSSML